MPRSGGTYSLPANTLAVSGNTISSTYYNNFVNDVATELTASVPRDGSAAMTARLTSTGINKGAYANLASSSTTDLSSVSTGNITITGTTTITSFGSGTAGIECDIVFSGALTLTHNATSLILPSGANITTAAGDTCRAISLGSGNWRVVNYQRAAVASPKVAQCVSTITGAVATGTTVIPFDDTIPQNTEGDQYMSLSITPKNSSSTLFIDVCFVGAISTANTLVAALFQDTTANALAASAVTQGTTNGLCCIRFQHVMTAGTTSSTTFKIRAGNSVAGTTTFNGSNGGRIFGGVIPSSIVITEILP